VSIREVLSEKKYLKEAAGYTEAGWITPKGRFLDIGRMSHISFILADPQKFGLSDDEVKGRIRYKDAESTGKKGIITYTDGVEDRAWDRIINKALENGFIRVRKVRSNKYSYTWYVDVNEFNKRTTKILSDWSYSMNKKDDKVIFSVNKGIKPNNMTMGDLSGLVEGHEQLMLITLNEMEGIEL
jgi:hypothetical protein